MADVDGTSNASVLIVAHRTAATPRLLDAVRERAERGPCRFTLLVPRDYWEPESEKAAAVIELAVPLLERASGGPVEAITGTVDPYAAVKDAVETGAYDEVLISTLPQRVSHWLRRDLPSRVEALGVPVTVVVAEGRQTSTTAG